MEFHYPANNPSLCLFITHFSLGDIFALYMLFYGKKYSENFSDILGNRLQLFYLEFIYIIQHNGKNIKHEDIMIFAWNIMDNQMNVIFWKISCLILLKNQ